MKKYLIPFAGLLFSPLFVFAAASDVVLQSGAEFTFAGLTLTVPSTSNDPNLESVIVDADNFIVTLQSGSDIVVSSVDRKRIDFSSLGAITASSTCNASVSLLGLSASASTTVYIAPSSDSCDTSAGDSSSSSSGGGGGGGSPGTVSTLPIGTTVEEAEAAVAIVELPVVPEVAQPAAPALLVSPVFNRTLRLGMSHPDVKRLQQLLNMTPGTRITESGVGSPGNETEYYGRLTQGAVERFQAAQGIVNSGTPETTGYGLLGPATRAKLADVFGGDVAAPVLEATPVSETPAGPVVSAIFTQGLARDMSNADIRRLQQLLNTDPDTRIAESGVGSSGNETNFFGALTERAVQKFQEKHGVATTGDPGYGYVGPATRAKLSEVFGGNSQSAPALPVPAETGVTEAELQAQLNALNQQVADLLKQLQDIQ